MSRTTRRILAVAFCTASLVLGLSKTSRADCGLTDWLFGKGRTTYSIPYVAPTVYAPAVPACGCAPAAPVAVVPNTTYRIAYRPVATVAYMPVTSIDSCSGCAVTMYQPARTVTYYGSLVPYTVGYAAPACSTCGGCSTYGCAPCSGYSSCGACSSCGAPSGGCSTCGTSVSSGYASSSGCSSCGVSGTPLPGPAEMSQPALRSPALAPSGPTTLGSPAPAPSPSTETGRTYAPGSASPPISPSAPTAPNGSSGDNRTFRAPTGTDAGRAVDPLKIQGVPPLPVGSGPQLVPTQAPRAEGSDRVTGESLPRPSYFKLLPSPPATVPAQTVSLPSPAANLPADDGGWVQADR